MHPSCITADNLQCQELIFYLKSLCHKMTRNHIDKLRTKANKTGRPVYSSSQTNDPYKPNSSNTLTKLSR